MLLYISPCSDQSGLLIQSHDCKKLIRSYFIYVFMKCQVSQKLYNKNIYKVSEVYL